MSRLVYWTTFGLYFALFFTVIQFVWNTWVPWSAVTDILALFVIVVVGAPCSAWSASRTLRLVKKKYHEDADSFPR